jgi:RsbT co-antagonist protein rsbRD N-terminal domain
MNADAQGRLRARLAAQRQAILEAWLARTADTYPPQAAQLLREQRDPFRNPMGQVLREGLPALLDVLLGEGDLEGAVPALDRVVRVRAVQDFTPGEAVGFLFLLKGVIREVPGVWGGHAGGPPDPIEAVEDRIDRLVLLGFDRYAACREQMAEIRVHEAQRRLFVLGRMHAGDAPPADRS